MKEYKVYQVKVTTEENAKINVDGWGAFDWCKDFLDNSWKPTVDTYNALASRFEHVGNIIASNLEECFVISNTYQEERIVKLARMHSLSIGDVLEEPTGERFIVEPHGFLRVA
jgi:hypothetical protein